ncbi:glycosyltransferase [Allobaculum fili]|uniref:glycosyltransferase n=1 Tax=Allobaculum fili TaxID=2834460 RepID=UPI001E5C2DF1|nr:glycosyltransferase [Allobaculum fili]
MKTNKTALICISDTYLPRARLLARQYQKHGEETVILTPDFSHKTKAPFSSDEEGIVRLRHRPYQKNLSWQRLLGHMEFARRAKTWLEDWKPDRIHCLIPANSLAMEIGRYKRKHPDVCLIFDINDLWPESLPVGSWFGKTPPAWIWKHMRNGYLKDADLLASECALFQKKIQEQTGLPAQVMYWSAGTEETFTAHSAFEDTEHLNLCYLGFVNNIIDLDTMETLFQALHARTAVRLHLIAQGQRRDEMVERLSPYCEIIDYGAVYDPEQKQSIFDACAFGINIMKPDVQAGLSMKTLDYLQGGLPVINSLEGDVHDWIEEYRCGINIDRSRLEQTAKEIAEAAQNQLEAMRKAARQVFETDLSLSAFEKSFEILWQSEQNLTKHSRK